MLGLAEEPLRRPLTSHEARRNSCLWPSLYTLQSKCGLTVSGCSSLAVGSIVVVCVMIHNPQQFYLLWEVCFVAEIRHLRPCTSMELFVLGAWSSSALDHSTPGMCFPKQRSNRLIIHSISFIYTME